MSFLVFFIIFAVPLYLTIHTHHLQLQLIDFENHKDIRCITAPIDTNNYKHGLNDRQRNVINKIRCWDTHFIQGLPLPAFCRLIISGDVELNPGPVFCPGSLHLTPSCSDALHEVVAHI